MSRAAAALLAALTLVLAVVVAVAWSGSRGSGGERPLVLAAASLTEVLPKIDPDARYSFGGSDQLAQQIRMGAPADVFLSASPRYADELFAAGLVDRPVVFATNSLVLIVPRRNAGGIRTVADLARRNVRLVVAGSRVPAGAYTLVVLQRLGLRHALRNVVSREPDVKGVVAKVALGEADAGFVYATDVRPVASKVIAIPLPSRAQPAVRYEAALVASSRQRAAARAFLAALVAPVGRRRLEAAGFGVP